MDNTYENSYEKLPAPKLSRTGNLRLYYCISTVIFIILILLLAITSYTGYTVAIVHRVAHNTQSLIDDVHDLIPEAKLALDLMEVLCNNTNFTREYKIEEWCTKL